LPKAFGSRRIWLSPDAALQYLKLDWATASYDLLRAASKYVRESDVVWDVGGNVGVFALAAAHVAGRQGEVLAIEADPFLASLLQKTACDRTNSDRRINVLCAAASSETGIGRFLVAERGRASNSLESAGHRSQAGGTRYVQFVPTVTLDRLLDYFGSPRIVKIDVEGAEAIVLRGAHRLLSECRPLIYIEVCGEPLDEVTSILRRYDYRLYDGDADDGKEIAQCAFNTLAVPQESHRTNRPA
jgi:FkbM family methyltransferase